MCEVAVCLFALPVLTVLLLLLFITITGAEAVSMFLATFISKFFDFFVAPSISMVKSRALSPRS
jgi:hypothetical protein